MKSKILSILLAVCLFTTLCTFSVAAAETFTYSIKATATQLTAGSEVDVVISLTNYSELNEELRGLQIDITDIDTSMFEVVSHGTLLTDATAMSNSTSHNNNSIRYIYLKLAGTMDKSVTDVMTFKLKLKKDIPDGTSVSMPVKLKFGTLSGNVTLTDSLVITGAPPSQEETVSVDVSWGSLEFVYNDGTWDTQSHKWVDYGWEPVDENSNRISVTNNGSSDVKIALGFSANDEHPNVYGEFVDADGSKLTTEALIAANKEEYSFWFVLYGKTDSRWTDEYEALGKITLSIVG